MKRITGIALIIALGFQFLMKIGILAYFELNQQYIIDEFCINKDKVELNCDGQCFLAKKLKSAESHDHDHPGAKQSADVPLFIIESPNPPIFHAGELPAAYPPLISHYYFQPLSLFFHPPKQQS